MKKEGLKKGVIDFMVEAAREGGLLQGFKEAKTPEELQRFAEGREFAISGDDCKKLIGGKNDILGALGDRKCY
jgi:hypothetical protein